MCTWDLERERIRLENTLNHTNSDFCATFMTVNELNSFAQSHPDNVRLETISTLQKTLKDLKHAEQTQSIFLYRAAADALSSIIVNNTDISLSPCSSMNVQGAAKNFLPMVLKNSKLEKLSAVKQQGQLVEVVFFYCKMGVHSILLCREVVLMEKYSKAKESSYI